MMSVPFETLDWDLPLRTRWRSRSRNIGSGFIDFDPIHRFSHGFPGFHQRSWDGSHFLLASLSL
jgi:hypothetical protein